MVIFHCYVSSPGSPISLLAEKNEGDQSPLLPWPASLARWYPQWACVPCLEIDIWTHLRSHTHVKAPCLFRTYIYVYIYTQLQEWLWLVVWNIWIICPFSWECHHPNWLIIFRGVGSTTNQKTWIMWIGFGIGVSLKRYPQLQRSILVPV